MILIPVIQIAASLYVMFCAVFAINHMSPGTSQLVRASYLTLGAGALGAIASALAQPAAFDCIFALGVALYLAINRRGARSPQ